MSDMDATKSAEAVLRKLEEDEAKARAELATIQQAKRAAQTLISVLRERGAASPARQAKAAPRKTNMQVLSEILEAGEPDGLSVSEVLARLKEMNHRLALLTRDPLKAVSNELAELRRRKLCAKDRATGKFHPTPATSEPPAAN